MPPSKKTTTAKAPDPEQVAALFPQPKKKPSLPERSLQWHHVVLGAILVLAFLIRIWNIEGVPSGLYPDESVNGIDALRALETGDFRLFYPNNYGREGLFINLQALAIGLFGPEVWALKLWSVIFGTLTVWGTYLLARELWGKRNLALVASFLVATSFWAINFSRIGFRAVMVPFLLVFVFFFLLKAVRTGRALWFCLSGLALGLGIHTYIAFRVAPAILVAFAVGLLLSERHVLRKYWKGALWFVLGAGLAAAPMFYEFKAHPEYFISRSSHISVFDPNVNQGNLPLTLVKTVGLSLAKYTFWGDQNWRHSYPPYPVLDPIVGFFFLIGLIWLVRRACARLVQRFRKHKPVPGLAEDALLLGWFVAMLMPEFLTNEGLPHALRSIGTLPVVYLIATLPFFWLSDYYRRKPSRSRLSLALFLGLVLFASGTWNVVKYHVFFAENPNQWGAFNADYTMMAEYLQSLPPETKKYVLPNAGGTDIDNGLPVTAQPIVFLTHGRVENLEFIKPSTPIETPSVILLMRRDDRVTEKVRAYFPGATVETAGVTPGYPTDFTVIRLP